MGYIQKNLMSGEYIAYEAKLHRIIYAWPFIVALLAIGIFFIPNLAFKIAINKRIFFIMSWFYWLIVLLCKVTI